MSRSVAVTVIVAATAIRGLRDIIAISCVSSDGQIYLIVL